MKKIAKIFSILLILNITSNSKADRLVELLSSSKGLIGNELLDHIENILRGILDLTREDIKRIAEILYYILESLGIKIDEEKLKETARRVAYINTKNFGYWSAKMGFFSLLPEEEQKKLGGDLDFSEYKLKWHERPIKGCVYRTEFDVREKWPNCSSFFNHVQNQGFCGSCWAVSTASAFTDRYCIERAKKGLSTPNNVKNKFSSYDLLSCAMINSDCRGGWPEKAWEYIKNKGICTGTDNIDKDGCKPYPFDVTDKHPILKACFNNCTNKKWKPSYNYDRRNYVKSVGKLNGVKLTTNLWRREGEEAIKEELRNNGPVVAIFNVYHDFYSFVDGSDKDGIYIKTPSKYSNAHAAVIVGYGTAVCAPAEKKLPDGTRMSFTFRIQYWIIRNSWGTKFNTTGFLKILRGVNECGIEQQISFGIPSVD